MEKILLNESPNEGLRCALIILKVFNDNLPVIPQDCSIIGGNKEKSLSRGFVSPATKADYLRDQPMNLTVDWQVIHA